MLSQEIKLTDELRHDSYDSNHPWSIRVDDDHWNHSLTIRQAGQGVRPLYILKAGDERIVGSKFSDLAALAPTLTPSKPGRLELLLFGHTCGTHTLFEEIDRLPPGDNHVISSTGIYSTWSDRITDFGTSDLKKTASIFIESLQQRIDQKPTGWLPLTGGVDSRTIASVLTEAPGIRTYTRGRKTHPEVKTASRIAAKLHLNHYPSPFPENWFQKYAMAIINQTGGMVSLDHGHAIHPLEHLNRLSMGIALPGINGEYGRGFWPEEFNGTPKISSEEMAACDS